MAGQSKKISFNDNAGDVTVNVDDTRVEFHTDGSIHVYTNNPVKVSPIANDDRNPPAPSEPKVGDKMTDGTIYAGISPDTGKRMYADPADAPLTMTFNEARKYASLEAYGHKDWRLPSKSELNVLFNNRAQIGGFNMSGSGPAAWYWSGTHDEKWSVWGERFSDGYQLNHVKVGLSSVRCVR